jgi:hypothetical protein
MRFVSCEGHIAMFNVQARGMITMPKRFWLHLFRDDEINTATRIPRPGSQTPISVTYPRNCLWTAFSLTLYILSARPSHTFRSMYILTLAKRGRRRHLVADRTNLLRLVYVFSDRDTSLRWLNLSADRYGWSSRLPSWGEK